MNEDTRAHLEAMEARLMTRMNDNQERLLERIRSLEAVMVMQASSIATPTEIARSTNMLLSAITNAQNDLGRRMTDPENK